MAATSPPGAARVFDAPLLRERGLNRFGIERTGALAAGVVVLVMALLVVIPMALHDSLGRTPMDRVEAGTVLRVTDGTTTVRVTVPGGWFSVGDAARVSTDLSLRRPGMNVSISAASGVEDARTYFDRQVRLLAVGGIPGVTQDVQVQEVDGGQVISGQVDGSRDDAFVTVLVADNGDAASVLGITANGDLENQQDAYDELVAGVQVR